MNGCDFFSIISNSVIECEFGYTLGSFGSDNFQTFYDTLEGNNNEKK